jgi:peroxiredoxin
MNKRQLLLAGAAAIAGSPSWAMAPGQAAPDFTLKTLEGRNLRLAEQRGQVVMLNFWATWCGPCKIEMPHLAKLHQRYQTSGFQLLALNVDEEPQRAASFVQQLGLRFPILLDTDKSVSRRYELATLPWTVLVDRDGRARHVHRGYRDGYEKTYEQQLRELLRDS